MKKIPELLAPAGNFEKMGVAFNYGADAVYLSGMNYGLRVASDNFQDYEIEKAVQLAHFKSKKVYITLNGFLHDSDLLTLPDFLKKLVKWKIDAVICSDLGAISTVREHCDLKIHLSTQASCINLSGVKLYKKLGVDRIILGREVSLDEVKRIKEKIDIELELFVHGAMCISYSGNCVISNYTFGRDSNRGGCKQSCRFKYKYNEGESHLMSSKDLNCIEFIDKIMDTGIDSLKIEGRMKSLHYLGTVCKCYREGIDNYYQSSNQYRNSLSRLKQELTKISNREYTIGNILEKAGKSSVNEKKSKSTSFYSSVGDILEVSSKYIILRVKGEFYIGDNLEFVPFRKKTINLKVVDMYNLMGEKIQKCRPGMLVKLPLIKGVEVSTFVRRGLK